MPKPSIGSALTSSIRAEQKAVEQRFAGLSKRAARADQVLHEDEPSHSETTKAWTEQPRQSPERPEKDQLDQESEDELGLPQDTVVRANFSMPVTDYELITQLRDKCSRNGIILSRSEVLRAGLHSLNNLLTPQLLDTARSIEHLKPGPVKRARRTRR
jgi:hypothetical protein